VPRDFCIQSFLHSSVSTEVVLSVEHRVRSLRANHYLEVVVELSDIYVGNTALTHAAECSNRRSSEHSTSA